MAAPVNILVCKCHACLVHLSAFKMLWLKYDSHAAAVNVWIMHKNITEKQLLLFYGMVGGSVG